MKTIITRDNVVLTLLEAQNEGRIISTHESSDQLQWAHVQAVGVNVTICEDGDTVLFDNVSSAKKMINGNEMTFIRDYDIRMVQKPEEGDVVVDTVEDMPSPPAHPAAAQA